MNIVYRLVWSRAMLAWVAVAELSRGRGKGAGSKLLASALLLSTVAAQAAPEGGQLVSGAGSIGTSAASTTIHQASPLMALRWQSFNVAANETVNFIQPSASAIAINRIADTNGSQIMGRITANGQVFLINPNGILFGAGAQVNVGGLVASTLDLNDASLGSNSKTFGGTGAGSNASVLNQGTLNATGAAGTGGYIALLGGSVSNQNSIAAPQGTVALGAGSAATLTFQSNRLLKMQIDQSVLNNLSANGGVIRADGGLVLMSAGARDALLASVVNNTGVIEARTVENQAGRIVLLGGMAAGTVRVGGSLDASAPNGGHGGFIETSAAQVRIADTAQVTTAAPQGKVGTWLIDPNDFTVAAGADISGATLSAALANSNVELQSESGHTAGAGNLNVDDAVGWSANTTLTLTASNHVNINANLSATGNSAGLAINPNTANAGAGASGTGEFFLNNGAAVTLSGAAPSLAIAGVDYTVINRLGAAGSQTASDLQGMQGDLTRHYALGSNIDASATAGWNAGAGFTPVGYTSAGATTFSGAFEGLGHTISNLTINRPGAADVGLFGAAANDASLRNVGLLGGSTVGGAGTGGLLGTAVSASISNSYNTGTVRGAAGTGGLAGVITSGDIRGSYNTGTVSGAAGTGGLVGVLTTGSISDSYNTAAVTGNAGTGGLVGTLTTGSVRGSYTAGNVSGDAGTGGMAGSITTGDISNSYTTGNVVGAAGTGGLAGGITSGMVSSSFTTGSVVGAAGTSSLAGTSPAGGITNSFAVSAGQTIDFAALSASGQWMLSASGLPILKSLVKTFTITAQDVTKTYDGLHFTGGNGVSSPDPYQAYLTGTLQYSGTAQDARNAGSYGITASGLTSNNSQYVVSYVGGKLTINTRALTVAATGLDKIYDGKTTASVVLSDNRIAGDALTLSLKPSQTGSATSGAFISMTDANGVITQFVSGTSGANYADKNAGAGKAIFVVGIQVQGADAGNYTANTTALSSADITPKALTVQAVGQNKIYDGSTTGLVTLSSSSLVRGDKLLLAGSGAFADTAAGTAKAVTVTGITATGGDAGNYSLSNTSAVTSATIAPKLITVVASGTDKVYDGNTSEVVTLSSSGVLTQDLNDVLFSGTAAFSNKNVGVRKLVAVSGISTSGSQSGNYTLKSSSATAYATVTAKTIAVTATAGDKVYDGNSTDAVSLRSDGVVAGDTVNFASSSALFGDKNVANDKLVTVSGITLSGLDARNYKANTTALSSADITPKALTVQATGQNKIYDGSTTSLVTLSSSGLVRGDKLVLAGSGAFADTSAGTAKAVTVTGITATGGDAGNYSLSNTSAVTSATITPKLITVVASGTDKVYDGNTSEVVTLSSSGVLTQDLNDVLFDGAAAFSNKNVGVRKLVAVSGISSSGSQAGNYTLKSSSATAYATVTAKTIAVTATASDKVYDGNSTNAVSLRSDDVVAGDTVNFASTSALFGDKNVANDKLVTVSGITLSGLDARNYKANTTALGSADITPKSIAVTATGGTVVYNATLNAAVTLASSGVVKGDSVNFANTAALMDNKNVGVAKQVTVSGLSALGGDALNYTLSNSTAIAKVTVTPLRITVTASGTDKIFDGTTSDTVSLQSAGVLAGDALGFSSTTAKFASSAVGTNKAVTVSGIATQGADAANYSVVNKTISTRASITQN